MTIVGLVVGLSFWAVVFCSVKAWAYPTEADPQELHDKRTAAIRWHRAEERRREEARREANTLPSATAPAPVAPPPSDSPIAAYLRAAGFPESVIPTMVQIALRESGGDPSAVNASSGACGLFQIFPAQPGCLDPWLNSQMAYEKWQAAGLSPWGG